MSTRSKAFIAASFLGLGGLSYAGVTEYQHAKANRLHELLNHNETLTTVVQVHHSHNTLTAQGVRLDTLHGYTSLREYLGQVKTLTGDDADNELAEQVLNIIEQPSETPFYGFSMIENFKEFGLISKVPMPVKTVVIRHDAEGLEDRSMQVSEQTTISMYDAAGQELTSYSHHQLGADRTIAKRVNNIYGEAFEKVTGKDMRPFLTASPTARYKK